MPLQTIVHCPYKRHIKLVFKANLRYNHLYVALECHIKVLSYVDIISETTIPQQLYRATEYSVIKKPYKFLDITPWIYKHMTNFLCNTILS